MRIPPRTLIPAVLAVAVVLGLGACSKQIDDRSAGEKVDATIAKVEQKTDQAVAEVKRGVDAAQTSGSKAMDAASAKVKDAAITTSINAELARDPSLSALKINVDTSAGRVVLQGTAPDGPSRDRATLLAQHVDGVVGVDNQLQVSAK